MTSKDHIGFRVDETGMNGLFDLCTPSFVDDPMRIDSEREVKYYAVSQDDQPELSFLSAFIQIKKILQNEIDNIDTVRNWSVYIRFHLFDSKDDYRKTPRYATLEIIMNTLEVRQRMFTRNSSERFDYTIADISEFEEAFKANIGWDTDRTNRRLAEQ